MAVIDNLNLLLAKRGISGAELSRALGLSNSAYSQWNTGKTKPTKRTVKAIADYLGVPVEALLTENAIEKEKAPAPVLDERQALALKIIESLPPDKRDKALSYLKYLASEDN